MFLSLIIGKLGHCYASEQHRVYAKQCWPSPGKNLIHYVHCDCECLTEIQRLHLAFGHITQHKHTSTPTVIAPIKISLLLREVVPVNQLAFPILLLNDTTTFFWHARVKLLPARVARLRNSKTGKFCTVACKNNATMKPRGTMKWIFEVLSAFRLQHHQTSCTTSSKATMGNW